jgi:hypothetical protein
VPPRPVPGPCTCSPFRTPAVSWRGHVHAPGAPTFWHKLRRPGPTEAMRQRWADRRDLSLRHADPHPLGAIVFAEDGASPRTTLPIRMHYTPDTDRLHLRHACATARPLSELVPRTAATGYRLQKLRASGRNPPCRAVCSSRRTERPLGVRLVDGSLGCPRTHNQFHPVRLVPAGDQQRASIR